MYRPPNLVRRSPSRARRRRMVRSPGCPLGPRRRPPPSVSMPEPLRLPTQPANASCNPPTTTCPYLLRHCKLGRSQRRLSNRTALARLSLTEAALHLDQVRVGVPEAAQLVLSARRGDAKPDPGGDRRG